MKVKTKSNYTYITVKKDTKSDFFLEFKEKMTTFDNKHLILDLLEVSDFTDEEVDFLKSYALKSRENGTSFVVMSEILDAGALEGEINVVPTLTEAEDFIEMEAIERELGF